MLPVLTGDFRGVEVFEVPATGDWGRGCSLAVEVVATGLGGAFFPCTLFVALPFFLSALFFWLRNSLKSSIDNPFMVKVISTLVSSWLALGVI